MRAGVRCLRCGRTRPRCRRAGTHSWPATEHRRTAANSRHHSHRKPRHHRSAHSHFHGLSGCVLTPMELASQSSSSSAESAEDAARNAAVMRSRAEAESAREVARAAARSEHRPLAELSLACGAAFPKMAQPACWRSLALGCVAHTPMVRARLAGSGRSRPNAWRNSAKARPARPPRRRKRPRW
eukprot:COSAG04_NODE_2429_length_4140_cov_10.734472_1_plen_184_part_00